MKRRKDNRVYRSTTADINRYVLFISWMQLFWDPSPHCAKSITFKYEQPFQTASPLRQLKHIFYPIFYYSWTNICILNKITTFWSFLFSNNGEKSQQSHRSMAVFTIWTVLWINSFLGIHCGWQKLLSIFLVKKYDTF